MPIRPVIPRQILRPRNLSSVASRCSAAWKSRTKRCNASDPRRPPAARGLFDWLDSPCRDAHLFARGSWWAHLARSCRTRHSPRFAVRLHVPLSVVFLPWYTSRTYSRTSIGAHTFAGGDRREWVLGFVGESPGARLIQLLRVQRHRASFFKELPSPFRHRNSSLPPGRRIVLRAARISSIAGS